jgi:Restriction endonuclease
VRGYSDGKIHAYLSAVDKASFAHAKGAALERLSRYLFESIPGVTFERRNILDLPRAHELDLAFWNDSRESALHFLDAVMIVECKATASPLGSRELRWFVSKLQDRGSHNGVLVALSGITGTADQSSSAHSEVLTAMIRDQIRVLVVTRNEIVRLKSPCELADLLRQKFTRLILDRLVDFEY